MNAQQLFDLAPIGQRVAFSNGQPKPPARFNRKVEKWESSNASGVLVEVNPSKGQGDWDKDSFVIRTLDQPHFKINLHLFTNSPLTFEVLS